MSARATDRAIDVLLEFVNQPVLTAGRLQQSLSIPKPTVYRILAGLEERGFLSSFGEPRQYRLGANIPRLYSAWSKSFDLASLSEVMVAELAAKTAETAAFFVPYGLRERLLIRQCGSTQLLAYNLREGDIAPFRVGSAGKVMLAFSPPEKIDLICGSLPEAEERALRTQLDSIRAQGYCISIEERVAGAWAASAAVRRGDGAVLAAIALLVPLSRVRPDTEQEFIQQLLAAARRIEQRVAEHM